MPSFFSSDSFHEFGLIDQNGNFQALSGSDWQNDFGTVAMRVTLKASGTAGWTSFFGTTHYNKSPAYIRIWLQYDSSGSGNWTDARYWNVDIMDLYAQNSGMQTGDTFVITQDRHGNYLHIDDDIPRNNVFDTRIKFQCTQWDVDKTLRNLDSWGSTNGTISPNVESPNSSFSTAYSSTANNYVGAFIGGTSQTYQGANKYWRFADFKDTDDGLKQIVTFRLAYLSGTTAGYKHNTTDLTDGAEADDKVYLEYTTNNGSSWLLLKIITPGAAQNGTLLDGMPSANTWYDFQANISNPNGHTIKYRLAQASTGVRASDGYIYDPIIVDNFKIQIPNTTLKWWSGESLTHSTQEAVLPAMWQWDTSSTRVRFEPHSLWTNFQPSEPFFLIGDTNDEVGQLNSGVLKAKVEVEAISTPVATSTTQIVNGVPFTTSHAIARAAKFILRVANYPFSSTVPPAGGVRRSISAENNGQGFKVPSQYTEGSWTMTSGGTGTAGNQYYAIQRMALPLEEVVTMADLFDGDTFYVQLEAYAINSDGNYFLIDSFNFSQSWGGAYHFNQDMNTNPWDYITFPQPGKNEDGNYVIDHLADYTSDTPSKQTKIGINDIKIRSTDTDSAAVQYYYSIDRTGSQAYPGNQTLKSNYVSGVEDNGTIVTTGSDKFFVLEPGNTWVQPNVDKSFYGAAGASGSFGFTGLTLNTWAYKNALNTVSTRATSIAGNLRTGWEFDTTTGFNSTGIQPIVSLPDKETGTWSIPTIRLYSTTLLGGAFWFRVQVHHRSRPTLGDTKIIDRWFPGVYSDFNNPLSSESNGKYYYDISGFIEDARLNQYVTSVYMYDEDEIKISVYAYNNIRGIIDSTSTGYIQLNKDYGFPHWAIRGGEFSNIQIQRLANATTNNSHRLFARFKGYALTTTAEAHYFRLDLYHTSITNDNTNLIGTYFTYGTAGADGTTDTHEEDNDRTTWIKATSFSDFLTKKNNDGTFTYSTVYLKDIHNSAYTGKTFVGRLRALKDDGNYLPVYPFHDLTATKTDGSLEVTESNSSLTTHVDSTEVFEAHQWQFLGGSGTQIMTDTDGDRAIETHGSASPEDDYFIKVKASSDSATRAMFDYMTIEMTNPTTGDTMTKTLPGNGNTYWYEQSPVYFTEDSSGNKINIKNLLNDRYVGTDINWTIRAYAYGEDLTNNNVELLDTHSGTFTIAAWSWEFDTSGTNTRVVSYSTQNQLTYYIKVDIKSKNSTDIADRFKVTINKDSNEEKIFYLNGYAFDTTAKSFTKDSSNQFMNIVDLLNSGTYINRHNMHANGNTEFSCDIEAQKDNGDGTYSGLPGSAFNILQPANVPFEFGDVVASVHYEGADKLTVKLRIKKTLTAQFTNRLRVATTEHATLSNNVNSNWEFKYISIPTNSRLGSSSWGATSYHDVYFDVYTTSTVIDRFDTTKIRMQIRNQWKSSSLSTAENGLAIKDHIHLDVSPLAKVDSASSSFSLNENTNVKKLVNVNIRQVLPSSDTLNPTSFDLKFTRSDVASNLANSSQTVNITFAQANVDNNGVNVINVEQFYDNHFATVDHNLTCEIIPKFSNGSVGESVTKTISMLKEPKISFSIATPKGMLLDNSYNEYVAARFYPTLGASYGGYLPNTENFTIDIEVKENKHNTTVASRSYILTGDKLNNYHSVTIPTGVNIHTNITEDNNYYVEITGTYDIVRTPNTVTVSGDMQTITDARYKMINHSFPKTLESLSHSFGASGEPQLQLNFEKINGQDTEFSKTSEYWSFNAAVDEEVIGSLDISKVGYIESNNNVNTDSLGDNILPWTAAIPLEANYHSDITFVIEEVYDNKSAINTANLAHFGGNVENLGIIAGETIPDWNSMYDDVRRNQTFGASNVLMNDIANYPNLSVIPTNIVVTNIQGNNAASGKRFSFDVPLDFNTYFTNSVPYFSFGLKVGYKSTNNSSHESNSSYITSEGNIMKQSFIDSSKLAIMQDSSIYKVRDFNQDENGKYYFDIDLSPSDFEYDTAQPSFTNTRKAEYVLMTYVRDELLTYYQEDKVLTEPVAYNDIENWTECPVTIEANWYSEATSANTWEPIINNFSVETNDDDKTQFDYYLNYNINSSLLKPYSNTEINARWRGKIKNQSGVVINTEFYPPNYRTFNGGERSDIYTLPLDFLESSDFNPFKDVDIEFTPHLQLETKVKNDYLFGWYKTKSNSKQTIIMNYRDLIVPTFESLTVDSSLNEDTIDSNNTRFENTVVLFYNKTELKDVTKVFTLSEEWVTIRRKVIQGNSVYDGGHSRQVYLYGTDTTKSSHTADIYKFTISDVVWNLGPYTSQGLNTSQPFVFEYEITPAFKFKASGASSEQYIEIPEKKVSSFLIPDEFPYANNGVRGLSNSLHNSKHSIELKWNYEYTQDVDTFKSVNAKIFFDLYWYAEETDVQRTIKDSLKPVRRKLEKIKQNQNISSNWNFIKSIEYSYQGSLGQISEHSYLWNYEKLETDSKVRVIVLTRIDSEVFGENLSQTFGHFGTENGINLDINTSDKARKNKMHNQSELNRAPNRVLKKGQEFDFSHIPNLDQIPISVTRKKAKPRGSDKPYSSST